MYWLFEPSDEDNDFTNEDKNDWQLSPLKKNPRTSTLLQRKRIKSSAGVDSK